MPTSSALCGRHGDKLSLAQSGRGFNFICLHLPLATSLWLVQLLAVPCEQLLLHPGCFKAHDFDFLSNHIKSYHLLFLILYAIYLISLQYPCLKSAAFCVCLCMGTGWVPMAAERSKLGTNAFLLGLQFNVMKVTVGEVLPHGDWGLHESKMRRGVVMPWKRF